MNFDRRINQILNEAGFLGGVANVVNKTASAIGTGIKAATDPTVVLQAMKNLNPKDKDNTLSPISSKTIPTEYKKRKYVIFNTKDNQKVIALFNGDGRNNNKVDANGNFYVTPVAGPDQSQPLLYCFAKTDHEPEIFDLYRINDLKKQIQAKAINLITVNDPKTGTPVPQVCPPNAFQDIGITGGVPMVLVGATTKFTKWYDYQSYIKSFNPKEKKPEPIETTDSNKKA
jgi:hypothetical protein